VTPDEIRAAVFDALAAVAPEVDPAQIDPATELRDQLEIDSMDLLNLLIGVHERTGVDIPERDYPQLVSIDDVVRYVAAKLGAA
jgi:acyl carrier protein